MLRVLFLILLIVGSAFNTQAQDNIMIGATSDLRYAMDSIADVFKLTHPCTIDVTYRSSGQLYEQIVNGAPFDLFFSSDVSYPEKLATAHMASTPVFVYAKGRIVIWSTHLQPEQNKMMSLLDNDVKKIAIADPAHAPYGKRAMQSLEFYNLVENVKPKLLFGENVFQATQFVSSGVADIGIIALSLALSPRMASSNAHYYLIPEESHQPLIHGAIITQHGSGNNRAKQFFNFFQTDMAIAVLNHFGFVRP